MKICPSCQEPTNNTSYIEIFSNGELVHGTDLCVNCQNDFFDNVPLYEEGFVSGHQILTQEELIDILTLPELKNCPKCNQTLHEMNETGSLGCPYCYTHFKDYLVDFNLEYHGSNEHIGKTPEKLKDLKLKLAHAKEHENFVEVAILLSQIKKLEQ